MTPCDQLYAQEKALQDQLAHAMEAGDQEQVQGLEDQINNVVKQLADLNCGPPSPPPPIGLAMVYQLDPCLSQLQIEIKQFLGIQVDLQPFVQNAVLAAAEQVRALAPDLVNNPAFATSCVQKKEIGGLWLTSTGQETPPGAFEDIVKVSDATYAFNLFSAPLHRVAFAVWNTTKKHIETSDLIADALSFFFDLVYPNQIVLNIDLKIHFKTFPPGSLGDGTYTATITYTLGRDTQGKLSSTTTANDVGQRFLDHIPDFGKKIVSLFPDEIPIAGTNRKVVFNYDNPIISETLGILVSGRDPLLSLFKVQPPPPPPHVSISGPFNISVPVTHLNKSHPIVSAGPYSADPFSLQPPLTFRWTGGQGVTIVNPTASSTAVDCDMTGNTEVGDGQDFQVSVQVTDQLGVSVSDQKTVSIDVIGGKGG